MMLICALLWARSLIAWLSLRSSLCTREDERCMAIEPNPLRLLPSVDELLQSSTGQRLITLYSRSLALRSIRASLAQARAAIRDGAPGPSADELLSSAEGLLQREQHPHLRPVI